MITIIINNVKPPTASSRMPHGIDRFCIFVDTLTILSVSCRIIARVRLLALQPGSRSQELLSI